MSKAIQLPDDLYHDLESVARRGGLTVAEWIATRIHDGNGLGCDRPTPELFAGLIGVIDSSEPPSTDSARDTFSAAIAKKFERQGFRIS